VLESLSQYLRPVRYARSTYIVRRGKAAHEMFFICKGKVSVIGEGTVLADLRAGQFFGEMGLIFSIVRTASVISLTPCDMYILTATDFETVKQRQPQIHERVKQIADRRFEEFRQLIKDNSAKDPSTFSDSQLENFHQIFCDIDNDRSGSIDIMELGILLERLTHEAFPEEIVRSIMAKMDLDRNGTIEFEEFVSGLKYLARADPRGLGSNLPTLHGEEVMSQGKWFLLLIVVVVLVAVFIGIGYQGDWQV